MQQFSEFLAETAVNTAAGELSKIISKAGIKTTIVAVKVDNKVAIKSTRPVELGDVKIASVLAALKSAGYKYEEDFGKSDRWIVQLKGSVRAVLKVEDDKLSFIVQ